MHKEVLKVLNYPRWRIIHRAEFSVMGPYVYIQKDRSKMFDLWQIVNQKKNYLKLISGSKDMRLYSVTLNDMYIIGIYPRKNTVISLDNFIWNCNEVTWAVLKCNGNPGVLTETILNNINMNNKLVFGGYYWTGDYILEIYNRILFPNSHYKICLPVVNHE